MFGKKHTIPRMTYLKRVPIGRHGEMTMFTYYDYQKKISGSVFARSRNAAKEKIRKEHGSDIEFWR